MQFEVGVLKQKTSSSTVNCEFATSRVRRHHLIETNLESSVDGVQDAKKWKLVQVTFHIPGSVKALGSGACLGENEQGAQTL